MPEEERPTSGALDARVWIESMMNQPIYQNEESRYGPSRILTEF